MAAAAARSLSAVATEKPRPAEAQNSTRQNGSENDEARWRPALDLPCRLTVELPLPSFKVSDFLALATGSVVATEWRITRDIPLRINGTLIAWGEFEGAGGRLAVRLTELA